MVFTRANGWEDTLMAQYWGVRGYPTIILMRPDSTEIDLSGYSLKVGFRIRFALWN